MREYTKISFYLVLNLLMQICSRTSPTQAEQLLLPNLVLKCLPVIRIISVGFGPGFSKCDATTALPRYSMKFEKKSNRDTKTQPPRWCRADSAMFIWALVLLLCFCIVYGSLSCTADALSYELSWLLKFCFLCDEGHLRKKLADFNTVDQIPIRLPSIADYRLVNLIFSVQCYIWQTAGVFCVPLAFC